MYNQEFKDVNVATYQSVKGYEAISKQFKSPWVHHEFVILQWKFIQRLKSSSQEKMSVHTVQKNRVTSHALQASVSMLNIKVQDSIIGKTIEKFDLFWRVAGLKVSSEPGSTD